MGFVDDIVSLKPMVKLVLQIFAALVCVRFGLVIDAVTWPVTKTYLDLGCWGAPITVLWIVLCTNAFNLIDGLDGLAAGVTAICSFFLLAASILFFTAEPAAAVILTALIGACLGFIPFNFNPAKIFMGDVGSQFLGFILATVSILGLFKLQTVLTFALPLADTGFAVIRRLAHGQSPFHADKGHFHHRLMALGLSQKQTVLVLYGVAAIGGVVSLWIAGRGPVIRALCIVAIVVTLIGIGILVFIRNPRRAKAREERKKQRMENKK
jgi:UDP-GlcNAc:undecaprenyl-phosphate GlcNAc-1-phosphate transferase